MSMYAKDFFDIPTVLEQHDELRQKLVEIIAEEPMHDKALEGGDREAVFKDLLTELVNGELTLAEAYKQAEERLPRDESEYESNNHVFASRWGERMVRTDLSIAYNQAVLQVMKDKGMEECTVRHSTAESPDSSCTHGLVGETFSVEQMLDNVIYRFRHSDDSITHPYLPDHPYCSHVASPLDDEGEFPE